MSANTHTINNLIGFFENLAQRHTMLNDFGYGPTYNIDAERQMDHPYLWVEPTNTSIERGENGFLTQYYTFTLYVMDKINKGDDNFNDVHSDTDYITKTLIASLDTETFFVDNDISIVNAINSEPAFEAGDDNTNGWMTTITLKQPMRFTPCNSPITPVDSYTVSLATPGTSIYYTTSVGIPGATGPQGEQGIQGATGATGPSSGRIYYLNSTILTSGYPTIDITPDEYPQSIISTTISQVGGYSTHSIFITPINKPNISVFTLGQWTFNLNLSTNRNYNVYVDVYKYNGGLLNKVLTTNTHQVTSPNMGMYTFNATNQTLATFSTSDQLAIVIMGDNIGGSSGRLDLYSEDNTYSYINTPI